MNKLFLSVLVLVFANVGALTAAPGAVMNSVSTASQESRDFFSHAMLNGHYVEVNRNGDQIQLTQTDEPGIGAITQLLQINTEMGFIRSLLDDEASAPSLAEGILYGASKGYEQAAAEAREQNTLAQSQLLKELVTAFPEDTSMQQAADLFVSAWGQVKSTPSVLKKANAELRDVLISARLGLDPTTLQKNPDLEKFIKANSIDFLAVYFHHVFHQDATGSPMILYDGKLEPWSMLKSSIRLDDNGKMIDHFYTYEGIVEGQPNTTLRPFKKEQQPEYGSRYILELVGYNPSLIPHVWIRLKAPDGDVYSIGWVSKGSSITSWWYTLSPDVHHGEIFSPDPTDLRPQSNQFVVTPIEISHAEYTELVDFIKEYQGNPDACYDLKAQGTGGAADCGGFVMTILSKLGIEVTDGPFWTSRKRPYGSPDAIFEWQQRLNQQRQRQLGELIKKNASHDELEKAMYVRPEQKVEKGSWSLF